jgi:hypothetical protein
MWQITLHQKAQQKLEIESTVKPVLTTTSEQWPPVNNGQPDPQTSQINTSFIGGTSEQRPLFWGPKGGRCTQV